MTPTQRQATTLSRITPAMLGLSKPTKRMLMPLDGPVRE